MIFYIRTWLYIRRRRLCRIDPIVWWTFAHDVWTVCAWLIIAAVAVILEVKYLR